MPAVLAEIIFFVTKPDSTVQKKNSIYLYVLASAGVWIYLMLRAWFIPPVHDEAATFFHYINHGEFLPGKALWDANNHILNSLLSPYVVKVFGISAFTIRLVNLLFFPVYAWFLYRLAGLLRTQRAQFLLLLTGLAMHGFVEYFAYSRGYGMSMAMLAGALYYSYRFFGEKKTKWLAPALLLYLLATVSNLTLQNSSLLFMGMAGLYLIGETFTGKQRMAGFGMLLGAGAAMVAPIMLALKMKEGGLLYYAADEDFWTAVITSFTQQYFDSDNPALKLFWFLWFGILVWLTWTFFMQPRKQWLAEKARLFFPLMFFGNLAGIFAMHYLMDVNFPSDRTGMHLVLYLLLGCIFMADVEKPARQAVVLFPALVFFVQFSLGANLSYSTYWKGEHLPERFWQRIADDAAREDKNPTVGGYRIRNLVWAWHNFQNGGILQNMQYPNYCSGFEEYQIFSPSDYGTYSHLYDSLDTDEFSHIVLARRKQEIKTYPYWDTTGIRTPENFTGEYQNLFETQNPDSFINKSWLVEADIKLYSLVTPPKIHLVASFSDADGNTLGYETSPLHWLRKEFRPDQAAITLKLWVYTIPPETKRIVIYLWNVDGDAYTLENAGLKIRRAEKDF